MSPILSIGECDVLLYVKVGYRLISFDMCLVGEPSASASTGDTIKIGRRGSLSGTIHIAGKQGHVAYPKTAVNAIHKASNVINALTQHPFDKGSDDFPGTSLQITYMEKSSCELLEQHLQC